MAGIRNTLLLVLGLALLTVLLAMATYATNVLAFIYLRFSSHRSARLWAMDRTPLDPVSLSSLHSLAEHVLAAVLHQATGRIGLRVSPGGFSTPPFGDDGRRVAVVGTTLVVGPPDALRKAPLTTLAAAAELAGVVLGAPTSVFTPTTTCDPDAPLNIDGESADVLAEWYALGNAALVIWATELSPESPTTSTLWPEHFDVGIRSDDMNYGASPGDEGHPAPYLYVGPSSERLAIARESDSGFWNAPFGATRSWDEISTVEDAIAFFRTGHAQSVQT